MISIYGRTFSEEDFKKIVAESIAKTDCFRKLGFDYSSGDLWKIVFEHITNLGCSISHFNSTLYRQQVRGVRIDISKEALGQAIADKLTLKQIAKLFECSQSNIRYWIKKFSLKLFRGSRGKYPKDYITPRLCLTCGETDPNLFYGNKRTICGKCTNRINLEKGWEKKKFARDLLGGKCCYCGFDEFECSLDIHHLSPEHKDPNFDSMRGWSLERISKELETCVLLCRNCHAAVHHNDIVLDSSHSVKIK